MKSVSDKVINVNLNDRMSNEDKQYMDKVGFDPQLFELSVNTLLGFLGAVTQGDLRIQALLVSEASFAVEQTRKSNGMPAPDSKEWKT